MVTTAHKHHGLVKAIEGQTFGRLTVICRQGSTSQRQALWLCECACGNTNVVIGRNLRTGITTSCGCRQAETLNENRKLTGNPKHGDYGSPEYRAWRLMLTRCTNNHVDSYKSYGGRGIYVCDQWARSYEAFLTDMGRKPSPDMSIERKDNSKGYSPENCVWATLVEQGRNKRSNHIVTANGKSLCLSEWSEITGIQSPTIRQRLRLGWSEEQAVNQPLRGSK